MGIMGYMKSLIKNPNPTIEEIQAHIDNDLDLNLDCSGVDIYHTDIGIAFIDKRITSLGKFDNE